MDLEHKREFIRTFMQSMTEHAMRASDKMPETWDGHEIRQWLADEFAREVSSVMKPSRGNRRLRDYRNDVGTRAGL